MSTGKFAIGFTECGKTQSSGHMVVLLVRCSFHVYLNFKPHGRLWLTGAAIYDILIRALTTRLYQNDETIAGQSSSR